MCQNTPTLWQAQGEISEGLWESKKLLDKTPTNARNKHGDRVGAGRRGKEREDETLILPFLIHINPQNRTEPTIK